MFETPKERDFEKTSFAYPVAKKQGTEYEELHKTEMAELAKQYGYKHARLEMKQFAKIEYWDIFDEKHARYFEIDEDNGCKRIEVQEGQQWVDEHNDAAHVALWYPSVTARQIWRKIDPETKE